MRLVHLGGILTLMIVSAMAQAEELSVCQDEDGFPPFIIIKPSAEHGAAPVVSGSSVEMIHAISQKTGIPIHLVLRPWKRCLYEVENGELDMVADAYMTPERDKLFQISHPYYRLTLAFFYSRSKFPNGLPPVHSLQFEKLKGCGLQGFSYIPYGIPESHHLDLGAGHKQTMLKLKAGRCDYFPEALEVMGSFDDPSMNYLHDDELGFQKVDSETVPSIHLLLSRRSPRTKDILPRLNQAIDELVASHMISKAVNSYLMKK
jgi:polar amino acid transport system substrate-binding protein